MKIAVIGGGPAGLYFSLLVKKWRPEIHIDLFERNAPTDTFGWGVVFSDKTLNYLEAEDVPSWQGIIDRFEKWENVDIIYRDEKITVRGNKFSGIARIEMLKVLQDRCGELGVNLHFRLPVNHIESLVRGGGYDLVVGADGVASGVRSEFQEQFKPDLSTRSNKYIWFGTRHLFHGLTLIFRENSAGVFAAHAYKFDKNTSTFIVECDPETWESAGFQDMDDDSARRYLEQVFHLDLQGEPLLSNNSKWLNFTFVRNRHWWTELPSGSQTKVCATLLGDSLATVHFSIGSGTKLALEDSIALFHAIKNNPLPPGAGGVRESLSEALAEFEALRRPVVEEYQEAAMESLLMFENLKDYMHLDPLPFAYKLMTRSGKVDHENLRRRDPEFVERYEGYGAH
jgi:2-polyprenyl-6-methoxyphenol hydroxylase-like FAD-dependent oxidoreductase